MVTCANLRDVLDEIVETNEFIAQHDDRGNHETALIRCRTGRRGDVDDGVSRVRARYRDTGAAIRGETGPNSSS